MAGRTDRKSTRLNSSHSQISSFLFFFLMTRRPPRSPLFPSTTLFRSPEKLKLLQVAPMAQPTMPGGGPDGGQDRSEEHTSELQSQSNLIFPLFFFNDPAPTEISPLSLHDALPISREAEVVAGGADGPAHHAWRGTGWRAG